jgi:hypothetical protein
MRPVPPTLRDLAQRLLEQEMEHMITTHGEGVAPTFRGGRSEGPEGLPPPAPATPVGRPVLPQEREALAHATDRVCQKLRQHLARSIGPAGFDALLRRALALAETEFPSLQAIRTEADGRLMGLRDLIQTAEESSRGLAAVVAHFLRLLSTFIGEDLALRLVGEVWPDVPLHDPGPGSEEMTT